jgi:uncharacterized protein (DUF488 family)
MQDPSSTQPAMVWTVGHSNRSAEEFLQLLLSHGVNRAVDVRRMPRLRRNPQFSCDTLPQTLEKAGISYGSIPELGGLRRPRPDSPNTGWKNASFQGYADYMLTPEFESGLQKLLAEAAGQRAALMCAEAVPWRCHRSLIADALVVRGIPVEHIFTSARTRPHTLHARASVHGTRITYPSPESPENCVVRKERDPDN